MVPTTWLVLFLLGTLCPLDLHGSHSSATTESSEHIQQNNPFAEESFRQLQSGEDSEEMVNQCCGRVPQFETIGYGVDGTQLRVDVGTCRQLCHKTPLRPLKRQEFDRYLKKYPNMDPVHIFLALQSRLTPANNSSEELDVDVDEDTRSSPATLLSLRSGRSNSESSPPTASCLNEAICRPSSTRRELHFGVGGVQLQVDVVEGCDCSHLSLRASQSCSRLSKPLRLHPDTPFETVVDVGECGGNGCGESSICRPIRNRTVSIEGPNGVECLQVIGECACTGGCYRVKQFLKVYDFSNVFAAKLEDGVNVTVNGSIFSSLSDNLISSPMSTSTLTTSIPPNEPPLEPSQPLTKMIDIGRCEGSCESGEKQGHSAATSKCLLRSPSGSCLSSLYGAHPSCTPTKLHTHSYTDKKGGKHSILSVTSCGCN